MTDTHQLFVYSVYDSNPATASEPAWPSHADVEIEADTAEEAVSDVRDALEVAAAGLSAADGYEIGQRIFAIIWHADGTVVASPTYSITEEDLA